MTKKLALITLTGGTCSGKSHLLNYARGKGYPCLISTTTRKQRSGEVEGVDYHFIDEKTSIEMERAGEFAEFTEYNGFRYGVTKKEFLGKLNTGLPTFLIVEPSGISKYVQPALAVGAMHAKVFVRTQLRAQVDRFKNRLTRDVYNANDSKTDVAKIISSNVDRLVSMITYERDWEYVTDWDLVLDGELDARTNFNKILSII